jgi:hypothetical protein
MTAESSQEENKAQCRLNYGPLTSDEWKEIEALKKDERRALTIRQPWLFALMDPKTDKTVENRSWYVNKTPFWILLHAAAAPAKKSDVADEKLQQAIKSAPRGRILAMARVAHIRKMTDEDKGHPFVSGPYLWQLDRIVSISGDGVACKGSLNRWQVEDSDWNACLRGLRPPPTP